MFKQRNSQILVLLPWLIFILLALGLAGFWLSTGGYNLKYDWGFSIYDWQNTWQGAVSAWNDQFLGNSLAINSGWLPSVLISSFGTLLHLTPTILLPILVLLLQVISGMGMYLLLKIKGISFWASIIGGTLYSFSPLFFIRSIIGFLFYLISFSLAPWFIRYWWDYTNKNSNRKLLLAAVILAVISAQLQFVVMLGLFILVDLILTNSNNYRIRSIKGSLLLIFTLLIVHLPWLQLLLNGGTVLTRNNSGSSLGIIDSLPHSALRTLIGADHHILFPVFDSLLSYRFYAVSVLLVLSMSFVTVFSKRDKESKTLFVLIAIAWPLALGPQLPTNNLYEFIYLNSPFSNIFREVYHWSFLITLGLSFLSASGISIIGDRLKKNWHWLFWWILFCLLITGYWLMPYWSDQANNYVTTHEEPVGYKEVAISGNEQSDRLSRTMFLPPLGFTKYKDDSTPGAANTDVFATSTNLAQLPYQSSLLDYPTAAQALRNNIVLSVLGYSDVETLPLLRAANVNQIITRTDLESEFKELFEIPYTNLKYAGWADPNYDALISKKAGIVLHTKYEGVNIYRLNNPSTLISLAEKPLLVSNDWSNLALTNGDVSFFINDLSENDVTSLPLPKEGDLGDYIASTLTEWNLLNEVNINYKIKPEDGWIGPNASWWINAKLASVKENYIYTAINNNFEFDNNFLAENYVPLLKYWTSPNGKSVTVNIGSYTESVSTTGDVGWQWSELPLTNISGKTKIKVDTFGEAGIAQLLIVPMSQLNQAKDYWSNLSVNNEFSPNQYKDSVEVTKVSTSEYSFTAHTDQKRIIVFRMGFDDGWRMQLSDGTELAPLKANGYAMAWILPAGETSGTIIYGSQQKYSYLIIIAGIWLSLLLIAGSRTEQFPR